MKKTLHMVAVLMVLGFISGFSLVRMEEYAAPRIEAHRREAVEASIYAIFPKGKSYKVLELGGREIFEVFGSSRSPIGYAFTGKGKGYQDDIVVMIGLYPALTRLAGIEILRSVETPGLGGEIVKPFFKNQFQNLSASEPIRYIVGRAPASDSEIQAITGATVTSRSLVRILNGEIEAVAKLLRQK
ncbi:MAG: FMN-binding protein [Candidatus Omnitrophica bacterium]|nr:FMN-binding protein [Candidatus Omnitrophota bacterium]